MSTCIQPKFSISYYATPEFAHVLVYKGQEILYGQTYTGKGVTQQDKRMHAKQIYTREYNDVLPVLAQQVIEQCAKLGFPRFHMSIRTAI